MKASGSTTGGEVKADIRNPLRYSVKYYYDNLPGIPAENARIHKGLHMQ